MESKSSLVQMNCMLRVDTQSPGWEKSLTKVIKRVKDVSYSMDVERGIVSITGEINPTKLLSEIRKAGKHAELIRADCGVAHSLPKYEHVYGYDDGSYNNNNNNNCIHTQSRSPYTYYVSEPGRHGCIQIQYDPHYHHHYHYYYHHHHHQQQFNHPINTICPTPTAPPMECGDHPNNNSPCIIT